MELVLISTLSFLGRATITTVVQEKRETRKESYNVESGDVMTIPAGTTLYLANQENEDLQIVKLVQPVNNPGEFKVLRTFLQRIE